MQNLHFGFLIAFLLVLASAFIGRYKKLGFESELLKSSIMAFVQIMALGYVLLFIFRSENILFMILIFTVMLLFAAYTAGKRVPRYIVSYVKTLSALSFSAIFTLGFLSLLGALPLKAEVLVPIAGMVIGNSLNTYTLCIDKLKSELLNKSAAIEGKIALGESFESALRPELTSAIKTAMSPIINNLQTLGIVFIPGAMTGMLIAGADPMQAAGYQLMIMYMIVSTSFLSAILGTYLNYRFIFINRDMIHSEQTKH